MLERRPFVPFEVCMTNDDVYQIRYSSCAAVSKTILLIIDPESDHVVYCALDQIASVNAPQPA